MQVIGHVCACSMEVNVFIYEINMLPISLQKETLGGLS